jgi:hypothetical protein
MRNEQLLDNDEICKACPAVNMRTTKHLQLRCHPDKCIVIDDFRGIVKATTVALIAWLDKPCDTHQDKEKCDPEYFPLRRNCSTCWQELKESVKHE